MRSLEEYIRRQTHASVSESLLDVGGDSITSRVDVIMIEKWIKENYNVHGSLSYMVDRSGDIKVSVNGNILSANYELESLTNGSFVFDTVTGSFSCALCDCLKSLDGCPRVVGGDFRCASCTGLESFKGAPEEIGGDFDCSYCTLISSFEHIPRTINGMFRCNYCDNIVVFKGLPDVIKGGFSCCNCCNLESLKGVPKYVGEEFLCTDCPKLYSLEGSPKKVAMFDCSRCTKIESLEGAPEIVSVFNCTGCEKLKTLKGAPKKIIKSDYKILGRTASWFKCSLCPRLKSLEGSPKEVDGNFICNKCTNKDFTTLKGVSQTITGWLSCSGCENLMTLNGIGDVHTVEVFRCKKLVVSEAEMVKYNIVGL